MWIERCGRTDFVMKTRVEGQPVFRSRLDAIGNIVQIIGTLYA
jgi:hypothetical protein